MRSYNGYTPQERADWTLVQTRLLKSNPEIRQTHCWACDAVSGIVQHLEEYNKPAEIIGLCHRCHTMLHERFRYPTAFVRYANAIREGWRFRAPTPRSHWREVVNGMCRTTNHYELGELVATPKDETVLDRIVDGDLTATPATLF